MARQVIPLLNCPSNGDLANPYTEPFYAFAANTIKSPIGYEMGLLDYALSKGVSDAFCSQPKLIDNSERGAFDYGLKTRPKDVLDGCSRTIAIGDAASGARWQMCTSATCTGADLLEPVEAFAPDGPYVAKQFWIGSGNVQGAYGGFKYASAGHLAGTLTPLNRTPVVHFLFDNRDLVRNCQGSLTNPANTHRVPGFRSNHPGGANFGRLDGSVSWIDDSIELAAYRALSTVAGSD